MSTTLHEQVEAAFQYRGDVTLTLHSGEKTIGYLYNREPGEFVELFRTDGVACRFEVCDIASIDLTGKNYAEGRSYKEWVEKKKVQDMPKVQNG